MSALRCHISISADGFVAGPNQSPENPLGEGGEDLHGWVFPLAVWREAHGGQGGEVNASTPVVAETIENVGAAVMGRNMFGLHLDGRALVVGDDVDVVVVGRIVAPPPRPRPVAPVAAGGRAGMSCSGAARR